MRTALITSCVVLAVAVTNAQAPPPPLGRLIDVGGVVIHANTVEDPTSGGSPCMPSQVRLAAMSSNSLLVRADRRNHYIMIDRPELVVQGTTRTINAARRHESLNQNLELGTLNLEPTCSTC